VRKLLERRSSCGGMKEREKYNIINCQGGKENVRLLHSLTTFKMINENKVRIVNG